MPRSAPSKADETLIAALAEEDHDISPFQLERWRRDEQLPRTIRHGSGRGAGSTSTYPEQALATARVFAREAWQGRSRHYGTLAAFGAAAMKSDVWVSERAVRDGLVGTFPHGSLYEGRARA